ncbi:HET-domain-containing protein [Cenococcum geophilum]
MVVRNFDSGQLRPFNDIPIKKIGFATLEEQVVIARHWLDVCQSTHVCLTQPSPLLPKRLIDVSPQDSQTQVALYESAGQTGRYACLSHCWGDSQSLCKSTEATLERNKQAIEWGLLPATFRDAIEFTRRLGLRYLWIDSICIIQDSSDDWIEQSALMADIYGRAYVTLCATSSASDDNGCFLATPELLSPHRIPCKSRNGTEYEVCVRGWPELQHISSWETQTLRGTDAAATKTRLGFPFLEDFSSLNDFPSRSDFPLLTRAWCFQERLLSPRLLHFTKGEIM